MITDAGSIKAHETLKDSYPTSLLFLSDGVLCGLVGVCVDADASTSPGLVWITVQLHSASCRRTRMILFCKAGKEKTRLRFLCKAAQTLAAVSTALLFPPLL